MEGRPLLLMNVAAPQTPVASENQATMSAADHHGHGAPCRRAMCRRSGGEIKPQKSTRFSLTMFNKKTAHKSQR